MYDTHQFGSFCFLHLVTVVLFLLIILGKTPENLIVCVISLIQLRNFHFLGFHDHFGSTVFSSMCDAANHGMNFVTWLAAGSYFNGNEAVYLYKTQNAKTVTLGVSLEWLPMPSRLWSTNTVR